VQILTRVHGFIALTPAEAALARRDIDPARPQNGPVSLTTAPPNLVRPSANFSVLV
jgi:hypothetical protein